MQRMYHLSICVLLIFSPTLFAMQGGAGVARFFAATTVIQSNGRGLFCVPKRNFSLFSHMIAHGMGRNSGYDDGRDEGSGEGYTKGYSDAVKKSNAEKLQLYRALIVNHKLKTSEEFHCFLIAGARDAATPRIKDLMSQIIAVDQKLNNRFSRFMLATTKEKLIAKKCTIQEELKRLDDEFKE